MVQQQSRRNRPLKVRILIYVFGGAFYTLVTGLLQRDEGWTDAVLSGVAWTLFMIMFWESLLWLRTRRRRSS